MKIRKNTFKNGTPEAVSSEINKAENTSS